MKKNRTTQLMTSVLTVIFVVIFLLLAGRFLYLQTTGEVQGVNLDEWADSRRTNSYTITAKRGSIYDRNNMALAQNRVTYSLYAIVDDTFSTDPKNNLKHVADVEKTSNALASVLDVDTSEFSSILNKGIEEDKFQVEFGTVGSQLSQETKNEIEKLHLPGIEFYKEAKRYYPNGTFASQVIGLAQRNDEGTIAGLTGIEAQLDDKLQGTDGSISFKRDKYNTKLLQPEEIIKEAKDGNNVYLTIDQKIQTFLEDALSQVVKDYKPKRITATIVDPKTGEVLAMSNRPSYNPNDLGRVDNWYNDVVSTPIEPGSTMKTFTLASAIEEGVFHPNETYKSGSYKIDQINRPVTDYNQNWGTISYLEGFQRSSNVAMSKLVWEKIGPDTFLDYLKAFHFNEETGIDLPREQAGTLLYNHPIEKLTASFGQGATVTPIQLIQAATAIANDGKMMKPYTIARIVDAQTGDILEKNEPEVVDKPVSKETANQVLDILETVITSKHGTGHNIYNLADYSVAGKTGTAQISNPEGGYLVGDENYIFSFLGMAPKEDPELVMYITVQQPELDAGETGSAPVSYIFNNVMKNSLHYLNIQPDKKEKVQAKTYDFPNVINKSTEEIKARLEENGLKVIVIGNGDVIKDSNFSEGEKVVTKDSVFLVTDQPTMPSIMDWSQRDVIELSELIGLDLETMGNGYVTSQSIEQGAEIKKGTYIMVEFSLPDQTLIEESEVPSELEEER
ncbi:Penicillin-binding protein 2B [Paraliobacillus sp. PM-2]|uniref:penicillin-binding protein n=1 Tax=Paraliobacillus sp. PM-2 TaxID=1462524 RepID=UPI00061BBE84|nr:penicillin-binding protein [Paraliobacillus sp. PM-2]CQR47796.1 Penicillin-binding protein 2B [Paraliobacillus sp. PM-2]